jgi:hypothetical protein
MNINELKADLKDDHNIFDGIVEKPMSHDKIKSILSACEI